MVFGLLHANSHLREDAGLVGAIDRGWQNEDLHCLIEGGHEPPSSGPVRFHGSRLLPAPSFFSEAARSARLSTG